MADNLKVLEENIVDRVENRITELREGGGINFPQTYSPENALKSAWLILQGVQDRNKKPVLESCTKESIANSLLDMVIQGLSPAKKQCYFVAYGSKLTLMRSYHGTVAVTKRLKGVKNVVANCIYEGDEFEFEFDLETGIKRITKHKQSFENIDLDKIKGAYAIVIVEDGNNYLEIMNINQIRKAWGQGAAGGNSGAHKNFTDEMAKKTVINRACKTFANTSDDSDVLIGAFNSTTENEGPRDQYVEVKQEIEANANRQSISLNDKSVTDVPVTNNDVQVDVIENPVNEEEVMPGQTTFAGPKF